VEKLIRLAQIFNVSIDELITGQASEHSSQKATPVPTKTLIGISLLCCCVVSATLFLIFSLYIWIGLITIPLGIISAVCLAPNERFLRLTLFCIGIVLFAVILFFALLLIFNLYGILIHV
jgi:hypothetical protein